MRQDEERTYRPRIGGEAPCAARVKEMLPVDGGEVEAEFLRHLVLSLKNH